MIWTILYLAAISSVTGWATWRRAPQCSVMLAVMWSNFAGTLATAFLAGNSPGWVFFLDLSSFLVLVISYLRGNSPMVVLPVASGFIFMQIGYLAALFGFIERPVMWVFADVFAYPQLALIAWASNGPGGAVDRLARRYGVDFFRSRNLLPLRLQSIPLSSDGNSNH